MRGNASALRVRRPTWFSDRSNRRSHVVRLQSRDMFLEFKVLKYVGVFEYVCIRTRIPR